MSRMRAAKARLLLPGHPLSGASVVVTRPGATAAALRRRIAALGGSAIGLPGFSLRGVVDIAAARTQLRAARRADIVVFTSPAAVRFAWRLLPGLRFAKATCVIAPGPGSARALRRHGVAAPLFPTARHDSEGMLELAEMQRIRRRCVALIGAAGGRDLLPRQIAARGARVMLVEAYRRTAPRLTVRHFAAIARAVSPVITLLSSADALANLRSALPAALFARLAAGTAVVSSARIAERAHEAGWAHVQLAQSAVPTALLDAAIVTVAQHRL